MSQVMHVVLVDWSDGNGDAAAEADRLVDANLVPLPGVLTVDRGPSISGEGLEDGFQWALVIRFENAEALEAYLPHPDHVVVGAHLQANAARLVVFDLAAGS